MSFAEDNPIAPDGGVPAEPSAETPPPEAPASAPSETPGAPTPAEGTPPAPEAGETPVDYAARVSEWGGEEAIENALAIANALQDEAGVRALVEEGLKYLNLDPAKVFTPEPEGEPPDPERFLTAAELDAKLQELQTAQQNQAQQQADQIALAAVDNVRQQLKIEDQAEWDFVRTFAQQYVGPEERDPGKLVRAVEQGYKDYEAYLTKKSQEYVAKKAESAQEVPKRMQSGGSPGGEEAPPPKNLDEARAAARAMLKAAGEV